MELTDDEGQPVQLAGDKWMIVPSVSVGNVPQLAIDLMVSSISKRPVAHVRDPNMVPVAGDGAPDFDISTGCELFELNNAAYALLPRAPPAPGRAAASAIEIAKLAEAHSSKTLVALTSAYAGGRRDVQLQDNSKLRYMLTSPAAQLKETLHSLNLNVMEGAGDLGWTSNIDEAEASTANGTSESPAFISSTRRSSFIRSLLQECEKRGIALCVILMFVFEGVNSADAAEMAAVVAQLTQLVQLGEKPEWIAPKSWEKTLGPPPESMMY